MTDTDSLEAALEPFLRAISQLEKEYGFDRPMHQGQCLMLPLSDLIALREAAALHASTDAAPVADWIGPVPCDGSKPDWLPDDALCMIAYNPRESQNAMTWEFAEKRAKPVRDRDWDGVTAFCFKPLAHPPVPDAAGEGACCHSNIERQRMADGAPVELCLDCGRLRIPGSPWPEQEVALAQPPAAEPVGMREAAESALKEWLSLPEHERSAERPWIMGFNAGWEAAFATGNGGEGRS